MTDVQKQIKELTTQLIQAEKDDDTITAYTLANKINELKEM